VHIDSCRIMLDGQIAAGKIKSDDVPDIEEFLSEAIDNSFVEELDEELKRPSLLASGSYSEIWSIALKAGMSMFRRHP